MGTRGRSGITRMFLGSVAERVLRRALQPVFVTQPG
jgi:nucleotide-binding universal stress UspA family protein